MNRTWLGIADRRRRSGGVVHAGRRGVFPFLSPEYRAGWLGSRTGARVLVYEVDPAALPTVQKVDMAQLVATIDRGSIPVGRSRSPGVRELDGQRIEVALYSINAAAAEHVDQLLQRAERWSSASSPTIATTRDLIEKASDSPSKSHIHDAKSNLLAWWVPVKAGQGSSFVGSPTSLCAGDRRLARETTEILVLSDDYNVPGAYLTRADDSVDSQGRPCISFTLNRYGGQLFGAMTSSHLPDKLTGFSYKLGIILDGEVYSAPSIQSTIYDSGQITGSFTRQEVEDLARVLNAGSLPARIRPVKK